MKKFFLLILMMVLCPSWGEDPWEGMDVVDFSIELKSRFISSEKPFPDFSLVFTNQGWGRVRLLDGFYPLGVTKKPDIILEILNEKNKRVAVYWSKYDIKRKRADMKYIVLKPSMSYSVQIKNFAEHIRFIEPLVKGRKYVLKVTYRDDGTPGTSRKYVGKREIRIK